MSVIVTHRENIRRGGPDQTSEALLGVGRDDQGGETKGICVRYVGETKVFTRPFNVSGGCGRGVDGRCSGASNV